MKKLSIITPTYWNELNVSHTVPRLIAVADKLKGRGWDTELIFVDDGSGDRTVKLLLDARKYDPRIKVVTLSRNFGSMQAMIAGFSLATGDCAGMITSDLQDSPELFIEMIDLWERGNKVIMAVRTDREESFLQRLFAKTFYFLLEKFALPRYPSGGFDYFLIDRQVVDELVSIREKNTNTMSLVYWLGHKRSSIAYVRKKRMHGKSRWTFNKKVKFFFDSFVAFSYAPIRIISFIGVLTALISFVFGLYVIADSLFGRIPVQGYSALMSIITFLLGLIMIMLGIIGEYLWRTLDEVRSRPPYIIDETYGFDDRKTGTDATKI